MTNETRTILENILKIFDDEYEECSVPMAQSYIHDLLGNSHKFEGDDFSARYYRDELENAKRKITSCLTS